MPVTAKPEDLGLSSERLGRITSWMARYVEAGRLPFALTLIARHGEIAYLDFIGERDVEAGAPMTEDTIFRAYSMSKPITSVAAMMLYEDGLFQLDDPLADTIPAFADMAGHTGGEGNRMTTEPAKRPVTIHHLLTHTSGLTYGFTGESEVGALYNEHKVDFNPGNGPLEEVVERLTKTA